MPQVNTPDSSGADPFTDCLHALNRLLIVALRALRDEAVEKYHAIEGGRQTLDNLAEYVAVLAGTEAGR